MTFTTDPTTDIGFVRLRVFDRDPANPMFSDDDITAFVSFEGDKLRASALALETIATSEVLKLKVIKLLQLSTDGASVGRELRMQADRIREQAQFIDAAHGGTFDWAEFVDDDFAARERLLKQFERQGAI